MDERPNKKRKVRKGTRSCWQCRKRKIRCEFASNDEETCNGCQARSTICISQEFADEEPSGPPERGLVQRLGRLEELMLKLADKIGPDAFAANNAITPAPSVEGSQGALPPRSPPPHLARPSTNVTLISSSVPRLGLSRPARDGVRSHSKYDKLCREIHSAFPSLQAAKTIVDSSKGPAFVMAMFYAYQDVLEGRSPTMASLTGMPDATKHPALLAKYLLQLIIYLQQMPPSFDTSELELGLGGSIQDKMNEWVTAASLVTANDELLGSVEGLECLILHGFYLINSGNLRKAWLAMRRALSMAQLMGIETDGARSMKSCDPATDPNTVPSSQVLWHRIIFCDRYISLLLGLSAGSQDNSFMSDEFLARDTAMERLEKKYSVIALHIIERNRAPANEAYAITQSVDCELENAAKAMGRAWWEIPSLPEGTDKLADMGTMSHLMLQIHHHTLLIMLHLPYMLRNQTNSRFDYSKNTCLESSRAVLKRCIIFRTANDAAFSCRHIDYSSLTASMTLLLGHLNRPPGVREEDWSRQRNEDRALAETTVAKMEKLALLNDDKLSCESADIIRQLLPIVDCCSGAEPSGFTCAARNVQLTIPYLGVININMTANQAAERRAVDLTHSQLPTPSNTTTVSSDAYQETPPPSALSMEAFLTGADTTIPHEDVCSGLSADYLGGWPCPGITAEAGDWTFQGVDTTFWSLLNHGIGMSSDFTRGD
ncbi:hypothetical protein CGRA01v4_12159 [Colletotrichum graminicola]|uniref:Zn(2)-C6 fungal-type domain-containing protein n=1 Tax=Colletotrichum graminicola (strain M1.001 / M2 / FGSC 10212) TaxID=645133 RepID=E3QTA9_COLGM|nr:uncharacterized protein GLRG_09241 [Colletotrichum graminicola M1.001]EFQ34097.1 hypothetical protein GLRG_09241 [Colletotrichum graminicola M1.001]WDK20870.1 hypothetical protein CGRA01v4_12159 [Colletotrichum graminicola]